MLYKALYGLRESPLMWYNDLSSTMSQAGFMAGEEACVFTNEEKTVFILVYVDDILVIFHRSNSKVADAVVSHLSQRYEIKEDEFRWYLGIRVTRNRVKRTISLCQDAYLEKIATKLNLTSKATSIPLPVEQLVPYEWTATPKNGKAYQERVGSIIYAAMTTRADVAKASSDLSRFLTNPSPRHLQVADHCIAYLYTTRHLAIQYDGNNDNVVIASDASFADDPATRRPSQGYVVMMGGGPVLWKAGLQDTVTTSTTEAELLSLERSTKEAYGLNRTLGEINESLGIPVRVFCDNLQTIRLVVDDRTRIQTRLHHVDIQNMWLKQEHRCGRLLVEYMTENMPTDGFTKALSRARFERFRSMLGMTQTETSTSITSGIHDEPLIALD